MKTVTKKITKEWFDKIQAGERDYELRLADFNIENGDLIREAQELEKIAWKKINHLKELKAIL